MTALAGTPAAPASSGTSAPTGGAAPAESGTAQGAGAAAAPAGGAAAPAPASAGGNALGGAPAGTPAPAVDPAAAAAAEKATFDAAVKAMELKLPEGFEPDASLGKFKELAVKHGLKVEGAQAVVDLFTETQKAQAAAAQTAIEQMSSGYVDALKADKDFGGAKYEQTVQDARKALQAFADPKELAELRDFFAKSPLGNFPPLVKALAKVGRASSEGKLLGAVSEGGTTPTASDDAFHRQMYPKTYASSWSKS